MLPITLGTSWRALVPELADELRAALRSPFDTARVLVDSPGTARLLSQALAEEDGILAGVTILTLPRLLTDLAARAGVEEQWRRWRSPRLVTVVDEVLDEVAARHPVLATAIARPGRRIPTAARVAHLFRRYLDHAPALLDTWSDGEDADVPEHLAWQPELWRHTCRRLGFRPGAVVAQLADTLATDETPTWLHCVDEVPLGLVPLVEAARCRRAWFVDALPEWVRHVAHDEPVRSGRPLHAVPLVEIHGSHAPARQAEVLRDELVRRFDADPTLEPRDVRIVCPAPDEWAPVLRAAFRRTARHPGAALRVAVPAPADVNHALDALDAALGLVEERATASDGLALLLSPGLAWRWGFDARRDDLVELVAAGRIHWGLDAAQHARHGLADMPWNTWVTGIDALLTGVAMGGAAGPRGVVGTADTTAQDLDLLGALAEVVGRIWMVGHDTEEPHTVGRWCEVALDALDALVGLPPEDRWMLQDAALLLDELARSHQGSTTTLDRRGFRRLLGAARGHGRRRTPVGNGDLHVVAPSEAPHVDTRLTVFLGLHDALPDPEPDALPDVLPLPADALRRALLAHARASERLLVVTRSHSERTGLATEMPVVVRLVLRELGVPVPEIVPHAPQPWNPSNFTDPASYDAAAHEGARHADEPQPPPAPRRRAEALTLPVEPPPDHVTLSTLRSFLVDPLQTFLRHHGIRRHADPEVSDELPLALGGLEQWQVTEDFVRQRLVHADPAELVRLVERSQLLPPGALGRAEAARVGRQADAIVARVLPLMEEAPRLVPVSLEFDGTLLTGSVTLHGDRLVVPTASRGAQALLGPWLAVLALAAQGAPAVATVVRPRRGDVRVNELHPPSEAEAFDQLRTHLWAHRLGRSRLVPAPFEPAFQLVMERRLGRFRREQWVRPLPGAWAKWRYPDEAWSLFYDEPTVEFFGDAPTPEDPPGDADNGFERWALALHGLLAAQGGSW